MNVGIHNNNNESDTFNWKNQELPNRLFEYSHLPFETQCDRMTNGPGNMEEVADHYRNQSKEGK